MNIHNQINEYINCLDAAKRQEMNILHERIRKNNFKKKQGNGID